MADDAFESVPAPKSTAMIRAGHVQALVPRSFDDAWRIAQAFAKSGMCPQGMDKPEQVLVAVMAGAEIGLAPFQAVQSFAVINNRPSLWGDGMLAVVRGRGVRVEERLEGEGDRMVAWCKVTRPDTQEVIERSFSVDDAKAAGLWTKAGPWKQYPKRMLQMRARAWALRDGCADMLRGIHMAEEAQDMEVISNEPLPSIEGADKDRIIGAWRVRLEQATLPEEIEKVRAEVQDMRDSRRMASNPLDGIEAILEQQNSRVCNGEPPAPPTPSPFEEEKEKALACIQMEDKAAGLAALLAWKSSLTKEKLSRCDPDEKNELNRLFSNCKKALTDG